MSEGAPLQAPFNRAQLAVFAAGVLVTTALVLYVAHAVPVKASSASSK